MDNNFERSDLKL